MMYHFGSCLYSPAVVGGSLVLRKMAVGATKQRDGKTYRLNQNHRWERLKDAVIHEADEIGRLGTSWALGKSIGGAVANVAIAHGSDPLAASIISETVVQAGAATALYAAQGERSPMDLAAYFVQQSAAACLGKLAHHGADHILETFNAHHLAQQAGAIVAGKGAGIGTAVTASKTGGDRKLVEFIANKAGDDLWRLRQIFGDRLGKSAGYEAEAELLYELARIGAVLSAGQA